MRTTREYLDTWLSAGRLTPAQHDALDAVVSRRRVSLFVELNALLYLGVLSFCRGARVDGPMPCSVGKSECPSVEGGGRLGRQPRQ